MRIANTHSLGLSQCLKTDCPAPGNLPGHGRCLRNSRSPLVKPLSGHSVLHTGALADDSPAPRRMYHTGTVASTRWVWRRVPRHLSSPRRCCTCLSYFHSFTLHRRTSINFPSMLHPLLKMWRAKPQTHPFFVGPLGTSERRIGLSGIPRK